MDLVWSQQAVRDLEDAVDYIINTLKNPSAARKLYKEALKKAELMASVPYAGTRLKKLAGVETDFRYFLCNRWMIFSKTINNKVFIVRFLYAKSNYLEKFLD